MSLLELWQNSDEVSSELIVTQYQTTGGFCRAYCTSMPSCKECLMSSPDSWYLNTRLLSLSGRHIANQYWTTVGVWYVYTWNDCYCSSHPQLLDLIFQL